MTITLPLPDSGLWPNARLHPQRKARLTRAARQRAFFATLTGLGVPNLPTLLLAKDRRRLGLGSPMTSEKYRALSAMLHPAPTPKFTYYVLDFKFPDAHKRDDDNALAACKAYRDGIADALRMDDCDFCLFGRVLMQKQQKQKPSQLEITLS
jgi:hypothetical protein